MRTKTVRSVHSESQVLTLTPWDQPRVTHCKKQPGPEVSNIGDLKPRNPHVSRSCVSFWKVGSSMGHLIFELQFWVESGFLYVYGIYRAFRISRNAAVAQYVYMFCVHQLVYWSTSPANSWCLYQHPFETCHRPMCMYNILLSCVPHMSGLVGLSVQLQASGCRSCSFISSIRRKAKCHWVARLLAATREL